MHLPPIIVLPLLDPDHGHTHPATESYLDSYTLPDEPIRAAPEPVALIPLTGASLAPEYVNDWDSFVGQEPMIAELDVYLDEAILTCAPLPHVLLASGMPGAGKTTLARLIAKEMGSQMIMLVPPFSQATLQRALLSLDDYGVLFIDEIHKLADSGPRMAENLLHALEEGVLYLDPGPVQLAEITIIGATTDADKLPETIIDRFVIKPYFQPYTVPELIRITQNFCAYYQLTLLPETITAIANACQGVPRIARELVVAARALTRTSTKPITPRQLLSFKQTEPDGLTRKHIAYLGAMLRFARSGQRGDPEYVAGEDTLMSALRENKPGLARIERLLIELGLIDRTPHGRRLTGAGVRRARELASN